MTLDSLERFGDDDLRAVISRAEELLAQHDSQRKEKALSEARATLAAVGLSLKDLKGHKPLKGPSYHAGRQYQHPTNKTLTWNAKGQKPKWLREVEAQGSRAIELP